MAKHLLTVLIGVGFSYSALAQMCKGEYYDSLHYDLRCVACGVQIMSGTGSLPAPAWMTLLSVASQKYHFKEKEKNAEKRRKNLIRMISSYGVCFTPAYRIQDNPLFWERVTAGYRSVAELADKENGFWEAFGIRFDSAFNNGIFGCDEEKGCLSGMEHFFKVDAKEWQAMTPKQRQSHFLKAVKSRHQADLKIQGGLTGCLNEIEEQSKASMNAVAGAFNFAETKKVNPLNVVFCQGVANTCGLSNKFCVEDWTKPESAEARELANE